MSGLDKSPANNRAGGMMLRKRRNASPQSPGQSRRQSEIVQRTWGHFREAAQVIAFLNTHNEALDGQPLYVATESDDGFERVERLLHQHTRIA